MPDQAIIDEIRRRLVSIVRCAHIKRAVSSVDSSPRLNFWRVIQGATLDIAVLDWWVVFGTDNEEVHWKRVVPEVDHVNFRAGLFKATGLDDLGWEVFWNEMKTYRNKYISHNGEHKPGDIYPHLDHALASAFYYYDWLYRAGHLNGQPSSLSVYAEEFEALAVEIAQSAMKATSGIDERVC